jgi:trehalose 6-phosphate synthase/phosphatase
LSRRRNGAAFRSGGGSYFTLRADRAGSILASGRKIDPMSSPSAIAALLVPEPQLTLLLDYDGTLAPIAPRPEDAVPDHELMGLLRALVDRPATSVHIVSGRAQRDLMEWFGELPISLWAEHGAFHRSGPGTAWRPTRPVSDAWHDRVLLLFEQATAATPGSFIERKMATVAWHYRLADATAGPRQAATLHRAVAALTSAEPIEVLRGKKVVEARLAGVSKASAAQHVLALGAASSGILAVGDDETDEELFAALPGNSVTVCVGRRACAARFGLGGVAEVRELLGLLSRW